MRGEGGCIYAEPKSKTNQLTAAISATSAAAREVTEAERSNRMCQMSRSVILVFSHPSEEGEHSHSFDFHVESRTWLVLDFASKQM